MLDQCGKVDGADVRFHGNFYDSKHTTWCYTHDHTMALLNGHDLACDSPFMTSRKLKGKRFKLKDGEEREGK